MKRRVIFGSLLLVASVVFMLTDLALDKSLGIYILLSVMVVGALWELYRMAERRGIQPLTRVGLFLALLLLFVWWRVLEGHWTGGIVQVGDQAVKLPHFTFGVSVEITMTLALCMGLLLVAALMRPVGEKQLMGAAFTAFGFFYVAFLAGFVLEVRFLSPKGFSREGTPPDFGAYAIIFMILVSKATDIFGYLVGSRIGKRRIAPRLSPKKSFEGLAAGAVGSAIVSLLFCSLSPIGDQVTWWQAILFGILVAGVGQAGDIAESYVKRSLQAKDSSSLIPEFGGLLDLIDGVLFTAPFTFAFFCWVGLQPG